MNDKEAYWIIQTLALVYIAYAVYKTMGLAGSLIFSALSLIAFILFVLYGDSKEAKRSG